MIMISKKFYIIIILVILIVSTVTAVIYSVPFGAEQKGDVLVYGVDGYYNTEEFCCSKLELYKTEIFGYGCQFINHFSNFLGYVDNLSIPMNPEIINASETKFFGYRLIDDDQNYNYNVTFFINDSWSNDTSSPYYGFTYGIVQNGSLYNGYKNLIDLNGKTITVSSHFDFILWFNVDSNMFTPPGALVPIDFKLTAIKINT